MFLRPLKKLTILTLVLGSAISLVACSDSDNSDNLIFEDNTPQDTNSNSVSEGVEGPLDALQTPLSEDVFGQLVAATTGTPLEGVLDCAGQAVVIDLLDVVDSIAVGLIEASEGSDPTMALSNSSENIQLSLQELANDLPGALTALAGDDCNGESGDGNGGFSGGNNPLSGTPLAPLGDALAPVLAGLPASNSDVGDDMDLQSLSAFMHELSLAFQSGLDQVPAEAAEAPIFGGILKTLETAFIDLDNTLMPLGIYNGDAAADALEVTLNHLLVNILTEIVPLKFIEEQAGTPPGQFTGPIEEGVGMATAGLGDNLLSVALPQLADALNGPLSPVLGPIENEVLPAILGPITDALAGGDGGDSASGPTGTPLDLLLGPITAALGGGDSSGDGPTGTPLDLVLGPLLAAIPAP